MRELDTHLSKPAVWRAETCNSAFLFIPSFRIDQENQLPDPYPCGQKEQGPMRAHGNGEGFLLERLAFDGFTANNEGHIQKEALAAPALRLAHNRSLGCATHCERDFLRGEAQRRPCFAPKACGPQQVTP